MRIRRRARRDHARDFALDDLLRHARIFHLFADGDLESLANQLGNVVLGRVVGHTAHRDGDAFFLVARGQRDLQFARGDHRVFEEQLVEIAEAKEEQRVGMLFLDRGVLPHQRSGRLAHRNGRNCADYNSRAASRFRTVAQVLHCDVSRVYILWRRLRISNAASAARNSPPISPRMSALKMAVRSTFATILAAIRKTASRDSVAQGPTSMWRYAAVLPDADPVTLGEGLTPMLASRKYPNLLIKDEGLNPTGSFKARGMSAAVTMARHYGLKKLAAPSAGNAGGALAAYAAAAGLDAYIFMPKDVPLANRLEVEASGAHLTLVDGLISDCGRMVAERKDAEGWFDVSTLKEPFRVEGKKTMGYEVAEQLGWTLPDAILYPTGGGVGLIGMWKAFDEMEELGWISKGKRPKMICVQSDGCAPIPKALDEGRSASEMWQNAHTLAAGLRVPKAFADFIILDIMRQSEGTAIAVSDRAIMASVKDYGLQRGNLCCPRRRRRARRL